MHSLVVKVQAPDRARSPAVQIKPLTAPDHTPRTGIVLYCRNLYYSKKLLYIFFHGRCAGRDSPDSGTISLCWCFSARGCDPVCVGSVPGPVGSIASPERRGRPGTLRARGTSRSVARRRTALFSPSYLWVGRPWTWVVLPFPVLNAGAGRLSTRSKGRYYRWPAAAPGSQTQSSLLPDAKSASDRTRLPYFFQIVNSTSDGLTQPPGANRSGLHLSPYP
jgi:hypothetical protein